MQPNGSKLGGWVDSLVKKWLNDACQGFAELLPRVSKGKACESKLFHTSQLSFDYPKLLS